MIADGVPILAFIRRKNALSALSGLCRELVANRNAAARFADELEPSVCLDPIDAGQVYPGHMMQVASGVKSRSVTLGTGCPFQSLVS